MTPEPHTSKSGVFHGNSQRTYTKVNLHFVVTTLVVSFIEAATDSQGAHARVSLATNFYFQLWQPLSGYDLKKMFDESVALYWSGNNNEIYRTLVNLHKEGLVSREVLPQENLPARKIYSITEKGRSEMKKWVLATTDQPQVKHTLLIQLAWTDQLSAAELDELLAKYEDELMTQLFMSRAQGKQKTDARSKPQQIYVDAAQLCGVVFQEKGPS
ncbi:MAG: PadR family transcriptional regulator [Planctomycetes bacterium]|nr:PadR family transcriptional regulator [Planctomycetota bacterium]